MKKSLAVTAFALLCAAALPAWSAEELTTDKMNDIHKLMETTGALRISQAMTQGITARISEAIKARKPDAPQEAYTIVAEEVKKTINEEMNVKGGYVDQLTAVFHKYLTHEEIKGLLQFYATPLGKKAVTTMPMMAQEGMSIGQKWLQGVAPKLDARIKARFDEKGIKMDPPAGPQGGAPNGTQGQKKKP